MFLLLQPTFHSVQVIWFGKFSHTVATLPGVAASQVIKLSANFQDKS